MSDTLKPYGTEIGQCPKCTTSITAGYHFTWCPKCSKKLPDGLKALVLAHSDVQKTDTSSMSSSEPVAPSVTNHSSPSRPDSTRRFVKRYVDLYRAARLLVGLGNTVKVLGISAGIGILLLCTIAGIAASNQSGALFFGIFIVGVVFGVFVGGIVFLLGILISAQGQILMAQADAAVHTSPFLTEDEKLNAMSVPS